jgi:hypothetical protein
MKNGASNEAAPADAGLDTEFHRGLGLFDATMVVVGSMSPMSFEPVSVP